MRELKTLSKWKSLVLKDGEKAWKEAGRKPRVDKTPEKRRTKVMAGIDKTLGQIKAGDDKPNRGWYVVRRSQTGGQDVAKATVRLGQRPLVIDGSNAAYVPADQLTGFYESVRKDVEAGNLDGEIAALFDKPAEKITRRRQRKSAEDRRGAAMEAAKK